jgi:hypothetical protein
MRHGTYVSVLCCCALLVPGIIRAQTATRNQQPYIVTCKTTIYSADPGKGESVKEIVRQIEARDSQGRRYSAAGSNVTLHNRYDRIQDPVDRRLYQVNRARKLAYFADLDPSGSGPLPSSPEMRGVQVNGVRCLESPAKRVRPDGVIEVIGTVCHSAELGNLFVHGDVKMDIDGKHMRFVTELEDLRLGIEPPPEWLWIPADFQLIPGDPETPASRD